MISNINGELILVRNFDVRDWSEYCSVFQMWKREMKAMEKLDVLEDNLVLEVGSNGEDSNVFDLSEVAW